jgi:subtilisin family serine protease
MLNSFLSGCSYMNPLDLVKLSSLMDRTSGRPEIVIALIDGPVLMDHPDLSRTNIRQIFDEPVASCSQANSIACIHGTFVAGVISANRGSNAPAICPGCTLLVRPIFTERSNGSDVLPSATKGELADAIAQCIADGATVVNLSVGLLPSTNGDAGLQQVLDYAARKGVLVVAAAGNQSSLGSSVVTRHPWVIPVASCNLQGKLSVESNIGSSIGKNGLSAPGEQVASLGADGRPAFIRGTSTATPFVTGTMALLWSAFPNASANDVRASVTQIGRRRRTLTPPLLDAMLATEMMLEVSARRSK